MIHPRESDQGWRYAWNTLGGREGCRGSPRIEVIVVLESADSFQFLRRDAVKGKGIPSEV